MTWLNPKNYDEKQRAASHELIRRGNIRHLLTPVQRLMLDLIETNQPEVAYFCCRKIGKTFSLILIESARCIKTPNHIYRHIFPLLKTARDVAGPIHNELKDIFPRDCLPKFLKSSVSFEFPNGSKIIFGGAGKENIDGSRGPIAHGIVLDEVASFDESVFDYALYSVLYPQLTTTHGQVWQCTTPPESPMHPWLTKILPRLKAAGATVEATVYDNPLLTEEDVAKIIELYGGINNPNFRREYLLEPIAVTDRRVVPEYDDELHTYTGDPLAPLKNPFTGDRIPTIGYVSVDTGLGKTDYTSIVAGFLDWTTGTVFIAKELVLRQLTTYSDVASAYNEVKEWIEPNVDEVVSIGDMFDMGRETLLRDYGINISRPIKFDLPGSIGKFRNALETGHVKIHTDCADLRIQCKMALWKTSETEIKKIEHSETAGHNDALMAAVYMIRYIKNFTQRPRLPGSSGNSGKGLVLTKGK